MIDTQTPAHELLTTDTQLSMGIANMLHTDCTQLCTGIANIVPSWRVKKNFQLL